MMSMCHNITCERVPGSPLPYFTLSLCGGEPGNKAKPAAKINLTLIRQSHCYMRMDKLAHASAPILKPTLMQTVYC